MLQLINFFVLLYFLTFIQCTQVEIVVKTSGIKKLDMIFTKPLVSALLEGISIQNTDKSMLLSFLAFSKKTYNLSKNARYKIFLQALSESMVDECDNAVEEAKDGDFSDSEREKLDNKISAVANELKHIKDVSMEIDFLESMMISILEALKYFQPVSDFTRRIIPKISFYCVTDLSLSILFDLILENMKTAGSKLPLLKINPEIISTTAYDTFFYHFVLWDIDHSLVPTQFLLWNIINGPDTFVSTQILITLANEGLLGPYLLKKSTDVLPVFRKFVKAQKQNELLEILNSDPDYFEILKEVNILQEGYEIFETVKFIDLENASNETLENYNTILGKGDEVYRAFYKFENIFNEGLVLELNDKIFKFASDFDGISCDERKRLLIRTVLNLLKCLPSQRFEHITFIDYEPLIDFFIAQGPGVMESMDEHKMFKRLFCLPYSKLTEPLLFKVWKFHFDHYPTHEAETWATTLATIMLRQPPDNPSVKLIKIVHRLYESFGLDFSELISLILFYSMNHEEVAYSREIIHYCKERKLFNRTQLRLIDAFEADLQQD